MRPTYHRAARLEARYLRDALVPVTEQVISYVGRHVETLGLYMLVCAFWGLVVYTCAASWPLP